MSSRSDQGRENSYSYSKYSTARSRFFKALTDFQNTKLYDFLAALPLSLVMGYAAYSNYPVVSSQIDWLLANPNLDFYLIHQFIIGLLVNLAMTMSFVIFIVVMLLRKKPFLRIHGYRAYLMALYGTYLSFSISKLQPQTIPPLFNYLSFFMMLFGSLISIVSIVSLGRAFSIVPEARHLVTTGAYKYIRNPMYLGGLILSFGVFLQFLSVAAFLIYSIIFFIQLERIKYEEEILAKAFPEFADYKKRTYKLLPKIY
jgi:protein-S-isoprenylcysteine O-methyltransferase Ste14